MRASTAMKLVSAGCIALLASMPAPAAAEKHIFDLRTGNDFESDANCEDSETKKTRYLQIEVFDYNKTPWLEITWRQLTDECGNAISDGFEGKAHYKDGDRQDTSKFQIDMYVCAPWGHYELEVVSKSTNGGNPMERIAFEVEYGPEQYHIWDSLNTPFFDEDNPPSDYAPIPTKFNDGIEEGDTFTWPLEGAEGYYSVMYSGPFPPLECPNLYPAGVAYMGCYPAGMFGEAEGPEGSANDEDPAENYRLFDGIDDEGVAADKVMTLEKCAAICTEQGTGYFGLESAVKCLCGDELDGSPYDDVRGASVCGVDYTDDVNIPEYKFLCSGESTVLCGTDTHMSVYSLNEDRGENDDGGYELLGCRVDDREARVMSLGPIEGDDMSAEICFDICRELHPTSTHFGTQHGNECFCTDVLGESAVSTGCTYECRGNPDETCGGLDRITAYRIAGSEPSAGDGYVSIGCLADKNGDRIMDGRMVTSTPMSAEICYGICKDGTNTHFGTQWGKECFCMADADFENMDKHGGELSTASHCQMGCAGLTHGDEKCGGFDEMSAYEIIPEPEVPVIEGPYTALGCFEDPRDGDKAMDALFTDATTMSADICYSICMEEDPDYEFFGTQWGIECWCSKTFSQEDAGAVCNMFCAGTSDDEICGGFDSINAFRMN
ncbi:unnamed protein product [Ectocarpus sp. 12 AP-2014]